MALTVTSDIERKKLSPDEIDKIIKSELKFTFDNSINGLKINNKLVLIVYNTLKQLYIEDIDNVTVSAPTGSGKSIISYLLSYIAPRVHSQIYSLKDSDSESIQLDKSYILTSSLMLQKQIEDDIDKFKMSNLSILMGSSNYSCTNKDATSSLVGNEKLPFTKRACLGMQKKDIISNFKCFDNCEYYSKLDKTSSDVVSVLNYAYWLKAVPNVYFPIGGLVICDEAHLLPDIISNTYSHNIKYFDIDRLQKIVLYLYPGAGEGNSIKNEISKLKSFFNYQASGEQGLKFIMDQVNKTLALFNEIADDMDFSTEHLKSNPFAKVHKNAYTLLKNRYIKLFRFFETVEPEDLFYDCVSDDYGTGTGFMYTIRDLNEKRIISDKFINRTFKSVFLSATYGNMQVFQNNFDFEKSKLFKLNSDFDFSKSPLLLTNSGWLNYKNFEGNIDNVISDAIKICKLHRNENGIIHTGTHYISNYIKNTIENHPDIKGRFLFYSNAAEKETIIAKLKNANKLGINKGYVLVGPSLYEGLDLKDDEGRFNIIIKAPYLAMTEYVKQKMERYPEWYFNNCLQKVEQAIGRTNRHINDYSKIYLLDNSLKKLLLSLNKTFIDRLQYFKL